MSHKNDDQKMFEFLQDLHKTAYFEGVFAEQKRILDYLENRVTSMSLPLAEELIGLEYMQKIVVETYKSFKQIVEETTIGS